MILPGNSRQVILDALADCQIPPHAAASKIADDLFSAGYGVIHRAEMIDILTGLVTIIKNYDEIGQTLTDMRMAKATALCELLSD